MKAVNAVRSVKYSHSLTKIQRFSVLSNGLKVFDSGVLNENKKVADEIAKYTLSHIKNVGTWGIKPPITSKKMQDFYHLTQVINATRELCFKIYQGQPTENRNTFVSNAIAAHVAQKSGFGNCGEMGALGLMRLSEIGWTGRAAIFQVSRPSQAPSPDGAPLMQRRNHAFIIIGLGDHSKVDNNNTQSYGPNAVICDPFSGTQSYPVSEMHTRLHNYYGLNKATISPVLAKLDPAIDKISLVCSNIFSVNEFVSPFLNNSLLLPKAVAIASTLHTFNSLNSRQDKLALVEVIQRQSFAFSLLLNSYQSTLEVAFKNAEKQFTAENIEKMRREKASHSCDSLPKTIQLFQTISRHLEHVMMCQDNVYTLISQLERYKNPNCLLFNT